MKTKSFNIGDAVKLTDHRVNKEFYEEHYSGFTDEWRRLWDEYVDKTLYVKNIEVLDVDSLLIYVEPLPDYVDGNAEFFTNELEGIVVILPEELFKI